MSVSGKESKVKSTGWSRKMSKPSLVDSKDNNDLTGPVSGRIIIPGRRGGNRLLFCRGREDRQSVPLRQIGESIYCGICLSVTD
jgi:hypothetical protein